MLKTDLNEFNSTLEAVAEMLGKPKPSPVQLTLYFRTLEKYSIETVKSAITAHISDTDAGRFWPTPAHIIGKIQDKTEGHISEDEAWSIALKAQDEEETVFWTSEISEAWGVARVVMQSGDKIGARMAFKAAYSRLTRDSNGKPAWIMSEGFNPDLKRLAVLEAKEKGRISAVPEHLLLGDSPLLLEHVPEKVSTMPPEIKAKIQELKALFRSNTTEAVSLDAMARAETKERQNEAARKVAEYESRGQA